MTKEEDAIVLGKDAVTPNATNGMATKQKTKLRTSTKGCCHAACNWDGVMENPMVIMRTAKAVCRVDN